MIEDNQARSAHRAVGAGRHSSDEDGEAVILGAFGISDQDTWAIAESEDIDALSLRTRNYSVGAGNTDSAKTRTATRNEPFLRGGSRIIK